MIAVLLVFSPNLATFAIGGGKVGIQIDWEMRDSSSS